MEKSWSSVPDTLGLYVNLKKVMAKLRKQLKTASPTIDKQISKHSRIEIGPVRLTESDLDGLEKTHMRLAIGEPEKGSSRVRLTLGGITPIDWDGMCHFLRVLFWLKNKFLGQYLSLE